MQVGPIYDDDLAKQLVAPLKEGARLHCFVDACKGIFALGLPSRTYTRADGWSSWEVALLPLSLPSQHEKLQSQLPVMLPCQVGRSSTLAVT